MVQVVLIMSSKIVACFLIYISLANAGTIPSEDGSSSMHPVHMRPSKFGKNTQVEDAEFWRQHAQEELGRKVLVKPIVAQAKNAIIFLGDGMSVPTVTAARIFKGQRVDNLTFGEEAELYMDSFPFTGSSKTFCSDRQVADSACSATAYLCGSKANEATIGVTPAVLRGDCAAQANSSNHVSSVLAWAQAQGKSTGIVTTTRVTHASPSGTFAHIADRDWENDGKVLDDGQDPTECEDIAMQLIMREPGVNVNVILGGGRRQFLPNTKNDPETTSPGYRRDGVDLIETWISKKIGQNAAYVAVRDELLAINTDETDYLFGLFDGSHLSYWDEQIIKNDPSLEEMTEVAIKILSKNPNGFFLFVEGGRIDHAHHDNYVHRALRETVEFDKAIQKGDEMTADNETLIVVTSDHAHVMYFAGYPDRGTDILSHGSDIAEDRLPYSTLGYGNGPGPAMYENGSRSDVRQDITEEFMYQPSVPIPLEWETHGGDDVLIFAKGPYAHLLTGVHQQSYIPHVVAYATCIGDGAKHCD